MLLSGKVAIVTGGGGEFGREISLTLARSGSAVAVADVDEAKAENVARQVRAAGGEAHPFQVNISSVDQIEKLFAKVKEVYQGVDFLVNNAAITMGKPALEVTEMDWSNVMDINLKGTFFMSQAAGKEMISRGGGNIVNIASISSLVAEKNTVAYSTSKTGVIAITRNLAREWARYNIRVNAVAPGYARTPMTQFLMEQEKIYNSFIKRIPLRRLCTAADVAQAVFFLISEASAFITGHILTVDGGQTTG